jgi:hypothetical protein
MGLPSLAVGQFANARYGAEEGVGTITMKMTPSLLLAPVLLSLSSQALYASVAVANSTVYKTLELSRASYRTDDRPPDSAVIGDGLLELIVGSVEPSRDTGPPDAVLELQSFALYALSRGRGVSESGQKAIADFRELIRNMKAEGHTIEVSDTRIGIEGETRICASFTSRELAGKAWMQMQRSLVAADLVQLKPERC